MFYYILVLLPFWYRYVCIIFENFIVLRSVVPLYRLVHIAFCTCFRTFLISMYSIISIAVCFYFVFVFLFLSLYPVTQMWVLLHPLFLLFLFATICSCSSGYILFISPLFFLFCYSVFLFLVAIFQVQSLHILLLSCLISCKMYLCVV